VVLSLVRRNPLDSTAKFVISDTDAAVRHHRGEDFDSVMAD